MSIIYLWRVERANGQDLFGHKSQEGRSKVFSHFGDDENEPRWQRLKESCDGNCLTRISQIA